MKQDAPHPQDDDPFSDDEPPQPQVVKEPPQPVVVVSPPQQTVAAPTPAPTPTPQAAAPRRPPPPPAPPPNIYTPTQGLQYFKRKMALYDTSSPNAKVDGVDFGVKLFYDI